MSFETQTFCRFLAQQRGAYSIDRENRRRRQLFSNDFSSETTGQISVKFHTQHSGNGILKICSDDLGLMPNMATMPIFDKNLKKSSSPEPLG